MINFHVGNNYSDYQRKGLCGRTIYVITFIKEVYEDIHVQIDCDYYNTLGYTKIIKGTLPECAQCLTGTCSDLKSKRLVEGL
jgi:hypothetical protein